MTIDPTDVRDALFDTVYEIAKKDKNFIFIADDMDAFSLRRYKKYFPKQYINIGVAEQNMIDVASGLASCGKTVCCFGICSYVTTRCYEQIKFSICSMNLPVTIVGIGAGFSFNFDGPTHHGLIDMAVMRLLPEITIYNPADATSAKESIILSYKKQTPTYIRIDKGTFPNFYSESENKKGFKIIKPIQKINIITTGVMTTQVFSILEELGQKANFGLVDLFQIKPLPKTFVEEVVAKSRQIITIEENSIQGGIGTMLAEIIAQNNLSGKLTSLAVNDLQFDRFGDREWLQKLSKIDPDSIKKTILSFTHG